MTEPESTPAALDLASLEKLKRLSDLELAKPGALTPGGFHARGRYTAALIEQGDALIAAARRLARLESALEFLCERYSMSRVGGVFGMPPRTIERAAELGWRFPEGDSNG